MALTMVRRQESQRIKMRLAKPSSPSSRRGQIIRWGLESGTEPFTRNSFPSVNQCPSRVVDKECLASKLLTCFPALFHQLAARSPFGRRSYDAAERFTPGNYHFLLLLSRPSARGYDLKPNCKHQA